MLVSISPVTTLIGTKMLKGSVGKGYTIGNESVKHRGEFMSALFTCRGKQATVFIEKG